MYEGPVVWELNMYIEYLSKRILLQRICATRIRATNTEEQHREYRKLGK